MPITGIQNFFLSHCLQQISSRMNTHHTVNNYNAIVFKSLKILYTYLLHARVGCNLWDLPQGTKMNRHQL